ncbi:hypothetical protein VF21_09078 [Pseudogymnoascus sp. 05NY08]|nr:hypothetical protein VF21_09078 [Pseudogymnoascus sp. 05NY08]
MSESLDDKTQDWQNVAHNAEFKSFEFNGDSELSNMECDENLYMDLDDSPDLSPSGMPNSITHAKQGSHEGLSDAFDAFQMNYLARFKTGSSTGQDPNSANESIKGPTKEELKAKTAITMSSSDASAAGHLPLTDPAAVSTSEAVSKDVVSPACATADPPVEPPQHSQPILESVGKKDAVSSGGFLDVLVAETDSAHPQQYPTQLSRPVKIDLKKLREPLRPETLSQLLESALAYSESAYLSPLKDSRISLLTYDVWDGVMNASPKKSIDASGLASNQKRDPKSRWSHLKRLCRS